MGVGFRARRAKRKADAQAPPPPAHPWQVANLQGVGKRSAQQDAFAIAPLGEEDTLCFVLADGMGGAQDGALIAQAACEAILPVVAGPAPFAAVADAIVSVSGDVHTAYRENGGCTLIAVRAEHGRLWFASVGDSQLFLRRDGLLVELNRRHEHLLDRYLDVLAGRTALGEAHLDPQAAALSSFVGCADPVIDSTSRPIHLKPGDTLLACSDGIGDPLGLSTIDDALALPPADARQALGQAVAKADLPDQDNYTAIVARYTPPEDRAAPDDPTVRLKATTRKDTTP